MSLIPNWAPNLHPLLVHFPISLLLVATVVDCVGAYRPSRASVRDTATWLYCGGALMAMAAYFSGLEAAQAMRVGPAESAAVTAHFTWADRTTWFFVIFASLRIAFSYIWRPPARWAAVVAFVVALGGVGLLLVTAEHGGRLVFHHGLGVATVPSTIRRAPSACTTSAVAAMSVIAPVGLAGVSIHTIFVLPDCRTDRSASRSPFGTKLSLIRSCASRS